MSISPSTVETVKAKPQILDACTEAYLFLAQILISKEKELY